jgi:hypothetical protein
MNRDCGDFLIALNNIGDRRGYASEKQGKTGGVARRMPAC